MAVSKKVAALAKKIVPLAIESTEAVLDHDSPAMKQNNKLLIELNAKINKQLSFKYAFMLGLVRGVGTVIGATIVAAIVLTIVGQAIDTVDDIPVLKDIIEQVNLEQAVER